jgi:hypothetical protein
MRKDLRIRFVDVGSAITAHDFGHATAQVDHLPALLMLLFRCCIISPVGRDAEETMTPFPDFMDRGIVSLVVIHFADW